MQTFLPHLSFDESAKALDQRRLGKQRVECYQILRALTDPTYGWQHHPAVIMWRGHLPALVDYSLTMCEVWCENGFSDSIADKIYIEFGEHIQTDPKLPPWFERAEVFASHRAMLYRKDPNYYANFEPDSKLYNEYVWPT